MPYVTSIERLAREEGLEQGRLEMVLKHLERLFKTPLLEELAAQVSLLNYEQLGELDEKAWDFGSLEDVSRWLAEVNPSEE